MKNLLIGVFSNYNWKIIEPWVISAKRNIKNADIVLIVLNSDFDTIDKITEHEVNVIICNADEEKRIVYNTSNFAPHIERFVHLYNYLKEVHQNYKYVFTTDVRDVIFQNDPFEWMENNLGDKKVLCTSEALKYVDEPWGNENLMQTYGAFVHDKFKDKEIFNVGILGGESEYIKDLCLNLFLNCVNRPIPIVDQAVFNVTVNTKPYSDIFKFCRLSDGFAVNAGTTNDPSKIDSFKPKLLEESAKFDGEIVSNSDNVPFVIVHQYDRVPEWNEVLDAKYRGEA
jgi:hypothetical protein